MTNFDKMLDQDGMKLNLLFFSLYITAFELLKDSIIGRIESFFTFTYDKDGNGIPDQQYRIEVTQVDQDILKASCLWLQKNDVITESEVEEIKAIRKHRNAIVHEFPQYLVEPDKNLNIQYFQRIRELLQKIELWWVKNVEIPTKTEFDGKEIDDSDINLPLVGLLDWIIASAFSNVKGEN